MKRLNRRQRIIARALQKHYKQRSERTIPFTSNALLWICDYSVPGTWRETVFGKATFHEES